MRHDVLELSIDYTAGGATPPDAPAKLYSYLLDDIHIPASTKRPAIVICPGGGYGGTCDREAEPVAVRFLGLGCHAFVLRYNCQPARYPVALLEVAAAVATLRKHAVDWHIDPDKIFVLGFSAGGHLAASLGMFWNQSPVTSLFDPALARPNGMILCYPVISSGEFANRGSFDNLLGPNPAPTLLAQMSLENQVTADTPPAFIWHTFDDGCVPVENVLMLATAMRQHHIPLEMHIWPHGDHGLALANRQTDRDVQSCAPWPELAAAWVHSL